MPKKKNVVSLSDIKAAEEDTVESNNDERNQITEAIKEEESLNPPVVDQPIEEVKTKPKRKPASKKAKVIEEESVVVEPVVQPVVDDRITLINIMRKYDILDLCKDGLKTLFTYEELYDMVIK